MQTLILSCNTGAGHNSCNHQIPAVDRNAENVDFNLKLIWNPAAVQWRRSDTTIKT